VPFTVIMGQTSLLMLLGFAVFARLALAGRLQPAALALVAWTFKPNLLIAPLIALLAARAWRSLIGLLAVSGVLLTIAFARIGIEGVSGFVEMSLRRFNLATAAQQGFAEGPTLLVMAQHALGVGAPAVVGALVAGIGVYAAVVYMWQRQIDLHLRLAALPLASVLTSLHAGTYELATWLAVMWLLLAYAREQPHDRATVWWIVLGLIATANLAVIAQRTALVVLPGVLALVILAWMIRRAWPLAAR
jgi:hypothetical protein